MATNRYTVLDRDDVLPLGPGAIIARAIADHTAAIQRLGPLQPIMADVATRMLACLRAGGKVLFMGNGGSASDAQHLAAELMGRFERERRALPAVALTTDTSILTAIANDYSYDSVFARQIQALARPGDVVVGISASGNSPNVLNGLRAAREMGATTVGITGRTGGQMVALCDVCLVSPADNTARIQETHILMGHIICDLVERGFVGDEPARQ